MVDYDFYTAVYLGSGVPEKAFVRTEARAAELLAAYKHRYRVISSGEAAEKMAVCAMTEVLYNSRSRQGVRSAAIGAVSISYEDDRSLRRELLEAARIYLDIYRGTGV